MSDTTLNQFVASGTAAERAAYTPTPPTPAAGPDNGYFFFETDTGLTYAWDGAVWVQTGGGGATSVTSAGTLTANAIVLGAGAKTVAALGSLGTTTTVLHGNAAGAPTFGAVNLTAGADVTGDLPLANLVQGSALSVLGVTGNSTADNASIAAGSDHQVMRRSGTAVAFGQVNLGQSAAVTGVLPVANGGSGTSGYPIVLLQETSLNNAQIIALHTTPINVCAAPGASLRIVLSHAYVTVTRGTAYTNIDAAAYMVLGYDAQEMSNYVLNDTTLGTTDVTKIFSTNTVSSFIFREFVRASDTGGWGNPVAVKNSHFANEGLRLVLVNGGSGNLTGGGTGSMIVRLYGSIVAVP